MNRRRAVAVLALLGVLDSSYLLLHKLGYIGTLACTTDGGCDVVNTSSYASIFGVPVAGIGVAGYLTILVVSMVGTQPRWMDDPRLDSLIALLAGSGFAFSAYLTYASLFLVGTACPYCLLSVGLIGSIFAISLWSVFGGRQRRLATG